MTDRLFRNNRGIAVIMALTVTLLVVTVALELHIAQRNNMIASAVARDRATLREMAASGIHIATAVLIKDRMESESVSFQEEWADAEAMAAIVDTFAFEQGTLTVIVADEMGKIQINALVRFPEGLQYNDSQRMLWERFAHLALSLYDDLHYDDMLTIIHSVKDWLDADDNITGLSGAESDYYNSLDPPYDCKNGPFDHLSELQLVRGITPELFFGIGGAGGLSEYITVYGVEPAGDETFTFPGRININTADLPVLTALLPPEYADFAPLMVEHREATSGLRYTNDLTRVDWYKNVPGMAGAVIDPALLTVSSNIFRIDATATLNNVSVSTTAVVERFRPSETAPWACKVLKWETQ